MSDSYNTTEAERLQEQRWCWFNYCPQSSWEEGAVRDKVAEIDTRLRQLGVDPGAPYHA